MSENLGWRTGRGFGHLAALRLVGLLLQLLLLRLVGKALSEQELSSFLLGGAILLLCSMLGTAGFLPPLMRRMAQNGDQASLQASIGPAQRRASLAGLLYLILALSFGSALLPTLALALLHLLLPLHLAAAPELLHGRTRFLARAELLARLLTLAAFAVLAIIGVRQAWPWLLCWWIGALVPGALLWSKLGPADRRAFFTLQLLPELLPGSDPERSARASERFVALGDLLRSAWLVGIHPILRAWVGPMGYLGFGTAFKLHQVGMTLPSALATTVQGPLSKGSETHQRRLVLRLLPVWVGLGLLAALTAILLSPLALDFLFPGLSASSRQEALLSLNLLMASWPALFGAGLCLPFLLARGRETQVALLSATALLLCFVLLLALLPFLGPVAAAWSLLLTETFVFLVSFLLVLTPRKLPRPTPEPTSRPEPRVFS